MEEPLQKSLERYDVLDRIAVGGMAEVFLAKASGAHGFEKTLAIKRILPELASDPEFAARFIAEAKVAVRLSHANVVQVFDFGRIGESLFIAMEYVDGLDLAALLKKYKDDGRHIPLPAALHIAIEIVRGLDFAHQHAVVHRDVSPSNILISRAGEVKLGDFGIAVAASPHRSGGTGPRKVMGKWRYMSPEQTRGDTQRWLDRHGLPPGRLVMRRARDRRPARLAKPELVRALAKGRQVALVVDDDAEVCAAMRGAGWPVRHADWMAEDAASGVTLRAAQEGQGRT